MTVDVIVPTYRRPELLVRCLRALQSQTRPADAVLVVVRSSDPESHRVVEAAAWERLQLVEVDEPGVVAALRAGVAASSSDVVAITDDDAAPRRDWLARLLDVLTSEGVGAAGGRDVIPGQTSPLREDVGRITRYGKLVGNHHLGTGPARDVDLLKGVNMGFRVEALALPRAGVLRGDGAEVNFEVLLCRWATKSGFRIVYDPSIQVDHVGAERHGADRRTRPEPSALRAAAYNFLVATTALDRHRTPLQIGYAFLVGSRDVPGVVRALLALVRREHETWRRWPYAVAGLIAALPRALRPSSGALVSAAELRRGQERRRLAIVAHEIHDRGGMERSMAEVVRRAAGRYEVHVYASELDVNLRELVVWHRVRIPRRPAALAFVVFFVRAGIRLRRSRADLVHTLGAIVPNRADVATVQFCHRAFRRAGGFFGPRGSTPLRRLNTAAARALARLAEEWCYRPARLRAFAAVSEGIREELEHHYPGIPAVVTPNGVDSRRFSPDPAARAQVRRADGLANGEVVALFVGGEWARKGLGLAIEGFAAARAERPELARLWVVGAGDHDRYGALAKRLRVADAVRFLGPRKDAERLFAGADIFVFPTLYEAFPLAVLEAAAAGLPIVSTPVNGVAELIGDGKGGILVKREPAAVAQALSLIAGDERLRREMGTAARTQALTYDWDRSTSRLLDLYADLEEERP